MIIWQRSNFDTNNYFILSLLLFLSHFHLQKAIGRIYEIYGSFWKINKSASFDDGD